MKKILKVTLISIGAIVLFVCIVGLVAWLYLSAKFLNFEKDYAENRNLKELTIDGYQFLDRNGNGKLDVYEDDRKPIEERAQDLLSQMTTEEKIHLLKGSGLASALGNGDPKTGIAGAVGLVVPTPRLGIPTVYLSDGPAGLRIAPKRKNETRTYYCTAFPIGTMLASTWNTDLVKEVGNAMGNEALEYGLDVILGPGANLHRNPLCGRNFEYYSEDPVLTGWIGAACVNGIQSNGVGTSVKHFALNNQETKRAMNDARVSDRALREIYLKGFEIIVKKSQPWTIMSSYNKLNGTYASENKYLLTDILRNDWGFKGLVMSDWFGGQTAPAQIKAGNDLLEPGTKNQWNALKEAVKSGDLPMSSVDTSAKRILKMMLSSRKMQRYAYQNNPDLKAHALTAQQSAAEGIVLLKNENTLPLQNKKNVALFGVTSYDFIAGGTGSGDVNEAYTISLEEGLKNKGYEINKVIEKSFETHKAAHAKAFIKPEDERAMFFKYDPPQWIPSSDEMAQSASTADVGIITIGRNSGEGADRREKDDFLLTSMEQNLIDVTCKAFHAAGKKVIVVLNIGGVIETAFWKNLPDAIVLAWQGGQEGGNSVATILSGDINPSGKLPMTFPNHLSDHASTANFPLDGKPMGLFDIFGTSGSLPEKDQVRNHDYTIYEEGIYVGYRHFDKAKIEVSYPFGFGLSYTHFNYSDLAVSVMNDTVKVDLKVSNTGNWEGKEVVQIYSSKPDSKIDRPVQELKAFAKTANLAPGETANLTFQIPVHDLTYWNEGTKQWTLEKGQYLVHASSSSRDSRLSKEIAIE